MSPTDVLALARELEAARRGRYLRAVRELRAAQGSGAISVLRAVALQEADLLITVLSVKQALIETLEVRR